MIKPESKNINHRVYGYNYGLTIEGNLIYFTDVEDKIIPYLFVRSQYGWRSGCRDEDLKYLKNVRVVNANVSACSFILEAEEELTKEEFYSKKIDGLDKHLKRSGFIIYSAR